jgi:hypothetical protein
MESYTRELTRIFATAPDKHAAHDRARPVLADMAGDPAVLGDALRRRVTAPGGLCRGHYPVIALEVASTPHYEVVLNCWLPLPGGGTDLSTKAIHHHGPMLLTTTTAFGPGYEHWLFSAPEVVDPERELFRLRLLERTAHPLHHQAFVDAQIAHLPMYVPSLTVTLALWSSSKPTGWRDRAKRVPVLERNRNRLRRVASKAGLTRALDLKTIEYFDFFPTDAGFVGMRDRKEFDLGPAEHYFQSLLHLVQSTENHALAEAIVAAADRAPVDAALKQRLLGALRAGDPIEAVLSPGHHDVPFANFRTDDIERALAVQV